MVEANKDFEENQTGGIMKENFDSDQGRVFQKETIDPAEMDSGLILDKKLEVNRGQLRSFKPQVGKPDLSEFAQPTPLNDEERLHVKGNASDQIYPVDAVVFGNRKVSEDSGLKREDPDVMRWDNQNR